MPDTRSLEDGFVRLLEDATDRLLESDGVVPPTPVVTNRDDAVMLAAAAILDALGVFDSVIVGASPSEDDASADLTRGVVWLDCDAWDEVDEVEDEQVHRGSMSIYVAVSDRDRRLASQRINRLEAIVCNALDRRSLAGVTLPDFTAIRKSRKDKHAVPPQRRHILTLEWAYLVEFGGGHDESDDEP